MKNTRKSQLERKSNVTVCLYTYGLWIIKGENRGWRFTSKTLGFGLLKNELLVFHGILSIE